MDFYCNGKKGICENNALCEDCTHYDFSGGHYIEQECSTNADRIRAMSDGELAAFLCNIRSSKTSDPCECCIATNYCRVGHNGMLDWLQQPAEVE